MVLVALQLFRTNPTLTLGLQQGSPSTLVDSSWACCNLTSTEKLVVGANVKVTTPPVSTGSWPSHTGREQLVPRALCGLCILTDRPPAAHAKVYKVFTLVEVDSVYSASREVR